MKEDKVLKRIHQIQTRLRKKHQGLSWQEEARLINQVAQEVAKKYGYLVLPVAKRPYSLS